jgi:hypothetical protein
MMISDAWESLTGDPLPWLLDPNRPNLHWRVLVELVGRPADSPAVIRARGGANAAEPIASLLRDLQTDGTWSGDPSLWSMHSGCGWRLLAAVQWGADPTDPRLQAATELLLETTAGEGGFSHREGGAPSPWLTARMLQAAAELGWYRHPRIQEALAWLEEGADRHPDGGWSVLEDDGTAEACEVTAVALLAALGTWGDDRRRSLKERAIESLVRRLDSPHGDGRLLAHPCLEHTNPAEVLSTLARANAPLKSPMVGALADLQQRQIEGGRWRREAELPKTLVAPASNNGPSCWVTLKCVTAIMRYAVEAKLPRMYPTRPAANPPRSQ